MASTQRLHRWSPLLANQLSTSYVSKVILVPSGSTRYLAGPSPSAPPPIQTSLHLKRVTADPIGAELIPKSHGLADTANDYILRVTRSHNLSVLLTNQNSRTTRKPTALRRRMITTSFNLANFDSLQPSVRNSVIKSTF